MKMKEVIIRAMDLVPFSWRSKIKNLPLIKQAQRVLLKKWVDNKSFVATISGGPAKGLVFPVQMPQDKLMWIGTWELDFAEALASFIKPGFICYDIGAYKGYYAGIMALRGATKVYVFEPMPANAEKVGQLISLNKKLPIELLRIAVSDSEGEGSFEIMPEDTMGKLTISRFGPGEDSTARVKVECATLDGLLIKGLAKPHFIKIDVEGAEEFVLRGAQRLLFECKPILMIEVHSREIGERCLAILSDHYSSIIVFETGVRPGSKDPEICHYIACA